jgi:sugar O-acyltransferase (sialic acid O-acetyltransferase NeuD family)
MKRVMILAAGGLGREAAATIARLPDWDLIGFLDDDPGRAHGVVAGKPVLGSIADVRTHQDASLLVCAGRGQSRRAIVSRLRELGVDDDRFATLIAPDVHVPDSCSVGAGSVLLSGTVLTSDVTVGAHVVTMPGVVLTHDNHVADFATLCARVTIGGDVTVGEAAYLGMGALVREQVQVAAEAVLGMGSVLLSDLPYRETWVGVPARRIRERHAPESSR